MAFLDLVVVALVIAGVCVFAFFAYRAYKGDGPTDFFKEAVQLTYDVSLDEAEINSYFRLKDKLMDQYAPDGIDEEDQDPNRERWTAKVPQEDRQNLQKALMRRFVSCIGKLDQVQRDKPGHHKLWQNKLISERYWSSLCDVERMVSEEIDLCQAEAEELEQGWKEHIFQQAIQCYRMQKQHDQERKEAKKVVLDEKKDAKKEVRQAELAKRAEIEAKVREERAAQKAMEALLREEQSSAKKKGGKEKPSQPASKAKPKKK